VKISHGTNLQLTFTTHLSSKVSKKNLPMLNKLLMLIASLFSETLSLLTIFLQLEILAKAQLPPNGFQAEE